MTATGCRQFGQTRPVGFAVPDHTRGSFEGIFVGFVKKSYYIQTATVLGSCEDLDDIDRLAKLWSTPTPSFAAKRYDFCITFGVQVISGTARAA